MDLEKLKVGDTVKVPNVLPFKIEDLREGFIPANPAHANRKVYIDTKERFLLIYDDKQLVAEFPITPGSSTLPAPLGLWKIVGIATLPVFRHDEGVLNHGVKSTTFFNLPPGPNNPVGVLWMGLSKPHVGVHGTNNPGDDWTRREPRLHSNGELGCRAREGPGERGDPGLDL